MDIFDTYQDSAVQIISINAINREGRVAEEAETFELPFPVCVGRDSNIITNYNIKGLPRLIIIDFEGKIAFYDRFADDVEIKDIIDPLLKKHESNQKSNGK